MHIPNSKHSLHPHMDAPIDAYDDNPHKLQPNNSYSMGKIKTRVLQANDQLQKYLLKRRTKDNRSISGNTKEVSCSVSNNILNLLKINLCVFDLYH